MKIALNKSSLTRQNNALKSYKQFLPSLELKQQQLKGIEAKAKRDLKALNLNMEEHISFIENRLPMLANEGIDMSGFVRVVEKEVIEENLLGLKLPKLKKIHFDIKEYSYYNTLHWIDNYIRCLKDYISLKEKIEIQNKRLNIIAKAVLKITQRVNLFDKVLIPTSSANIKKIKIALSDDERSAVVRSKIAKSMHEKETGGKQ